MPKITYDLTSSSNWNNLSGGEHTLQVVAKATGYLDSAKSTSVSFTKEVVTTKETWVLNDQLTITSSASFIIDFVSNNQNFNMFRLSIGVAPNAALIYRNVPESSVTAYNNGSWGDVAYKTVTFETAPTGDLLAWLQANAVKQSEG